MGIILLFMNGDYDMVIISFMYFIGWNLFSFVIWTITMWILNFCLFNNAIDAVIIIVLSLIIGTINWIGYYFMTPRVNSEEIIDLLRNCSDDHQ